ncbi:MAG: cell division protein FtsA, partial [Bosea sp. (in: a-proteobacteria)]
MSLFSQGLTPRLKPLSTRKSATLSVLDIGTSKIVCLVAELLPTESSERLRGRTHLARILGIGHQRSLGLKGGSVIDLEQAERSIRQAVDAAERMAHCEVRSVIVNLTGGRLGSQHFAASVDLRGGAVNDADVRRVLASAAMHSIRPGRAVLHALPTGYALDG